VLDELEREEKELYEDALLRELNELIELTLLADELPELIEL
jgi:hypothetical protein